jgi:hypothetical protein
MKSRQRGGLIFQESADVLPAKIFERKHACPAAVMVIGRIEPVTVAERSSNERPATTLMRSSYQSVHFSHITVPALPHHGRLLIFLDVDDHAEADVGKALARLDLGDPHSIQVASTLLGRRMVCSPG